MQQAMRVLTSSESNDWYTPPRYIEAAREAMGGIDLDPASCEAANRWIQAYRYYSSNGLQATWWGRVWLNPPYGKTGSRSNQDVWARKLEAEYLDGYVTQAILLTKAVPGYAWWERLFRAWPVCFAEDRIEFLRLDPRTGEVASKGRAKAGASFWYVGPASRWPRFRQVFGQFGRVIDPPERPRSTG